MSPYERLCTHSQSIFVTKACNSVTFERMMCVRVYGRGVRGARESGKGGRMEMGA